MYKPAKESRVPDTTLYVCDGIVDCPDGEDEVQRQNQSVSCPRLLRCSKEKRCIHYHYVCDGIIHCREWYDDEKLCTINSCPRGGLCFGYTFICQGINTNKIKMIPREIRSIHIYDTNTTQLDIYKLVKISQFLVSIDISNNSISKIHCL